VEPTSGTAPRKRPARAGSAEPFALDRNMG